eukprot:jgi/Tetstr1/447444/TSEL_003703.t1
MWPPDPRRRVMRDVPVNEAALAVDNMRVPFQYLKQHVVAGLLSMRNALVARAKKLGQGASPDVRHVTTGDEAERRATERALVDNMKEAYVSVLAPSQLGVGISEWDSMLIPWRPPYRREAGPRAVIVHTDLRNTYNELAEGLLPAYD